jgi:lysophospholipase L1-like esterase
MACSSTDVSAPPPTSEPVAATAPATSKPVVALDKGDRYVALGSSIASGYGISVQSTGCGRSNRNYANLIAARYGLALTDVTCGAATTANVVDTAQGDFPPQLSALTPDTRLITVAVGGNDIGYNATAVACGDPDTTCHAPADLDARLAKDRADLATMLERIRTLAPAASVVFVTYPREVPAGNCPELSFTDDEAAVVRSMGEQLQAVFADLAAHTTGVTFVDPYVAAGDHTGCAPADRRWTAGAVADDGFAYHPTALGHEVMAQMIEDALDG